MTWLHRIFCVLSVGFTLLSFGTIADAQDLPAPNSSPIAPEQCQSLVGGSLTELPSAPTWIISATYRPRTAERRAYCEVEGYVNPTVNFGMYMPAEGWNGKYIVRGCGGSCGKVLTEGACGRHLRDGYACIHTDMGHRSDQTDNNWVANNLQGLVDFGYRATHVTTTAGKAILTQYYGQPQKRSYFFACSTGGRQAMIEAQRFPDDFDGVVAVAPVNINGFGFPHNHGKPANLRADGTPIVTDAQVPMIYKAVLARCDMNDGVKDGLVDPRDCTFDPAELQCKPGQNDPRKCLTGEQVETVRGFYRFGAAPGAELQWINNWTGEAAKQGDFKQSRGDPAVIETLNNAGNPDLRAFKAQGGKLILAHGTTDLIVTPAASTDYYELTTRAMGGPEATKEFFRYFMIPGMDHCSGGDGAWGIDYIGAIDRWVEQGEAPDRLIGIRPRPEAKLDYFGLDTRFVKPEHIEFSRPYFPYPLRAYYSGRGDPTEAASFVSGLKPTGRKANIAPTTPPAADELTARISAMITTTEKAYVASGLPPKNISDRIGKQLRIMLYNSGATDQVIAQALTGVDAKALSAIASRAFLPLVEEYRQ